MKKLLKLTLRLTLIALLIAVAAYFIPTRYVLRAPGHADDLSQIVTVAGGHPDTSGRLFMTTVIVEKANALFCLYALFDPHAMLESQDDLNHYGTSSPPPGAVMQQMTTPEDMMEQSKFVAKVVALRKLGYDIKLDSTGVRVLDFLDGAPGTVLLKQDVIDDVDGKRVRTVAQLRTVLNGRKPGEVVTAQIRRDGKSIEVKFPLTSRGGHTLVGVLSQDAVEIMKLPRDITITTHNVNGASAGLMFTLEIIDQLTPGGITHGNKIAGTGTIELDGHVGPIEGTELKEIAASRVGATVFLVPTDNYADIKGKLPDLKVIPVKTVDDALKALKTL